MEAGVPAPRSAARAHALHPAPRPRPHHRRDLRGVALAAWAEVVDHPDPEQRRRHERAGTALDYAEGLRATDPRRVAAYFTKHGLMAAKEYQHHVPDEWSEPGTGPGRFWGVWTLQRAVRTVHVHPRTASGPAASPAAGPGHSAARTRPGSRASTSHRRVRSGGVPLPRAA